MTGEEQHNHDDHGPGGHNHARGANRRAVGIAAALTGGFMLAEVAGGLISGSLALLADAGHMLTDFASLVLAYIAFRVADRPADPQRTYGFDRVSVLAAFVNGLTLLAICVWITIEAVQRFLSPGEIEAGLMLWVAIGGLVVNIVAFWVLTRGQSDNLNIRAATLHVMGDLLGSVAAILGAIIIMWTGWVTVDPLLSLLVVALILRSAIAVTRASGHILLEGAPEGFDTAAVATRLEALPGVIRAHHIHAWSISQERPMVTLEVDLAPGAEREDVCRRVKDLLDSDFGVGHATVEINRP